MFANNGVSSLIFSANFQNRPTRKALLRWSCIAWQSFERIDAESAEKVGNCYVSIYRFVIYFFFSDTVYSWSDTSAGKILVGNGENELAVCYETLPGSARRTCNPSEQGGRRQDVFVDQIRSVG